MVDLLNVITHMFGFFLGILAIFMSLFKNINEKKISFLIYGICCVILYLSSVFYHWDFNKNVKRILQKIDHSSIFVMISGTYTCLVQFAIRTTTAWIIVCGMWIGSLTGIILNMINVKKFSKFSLFLYILMGWSAVLIFKPLVNNLNIMQLSCLIIGGFFYTIGIIFYLLGKRKNWWHVIWHIFVLLGSISHFLLFV